MCLGVSMHHCHAACWLRERTSYHGVNECCRLPRGAVRGLGEAFSQPQAPEEPKKPRESQALVLGELLLPAAQGPEVPNPPANAQLPWEPCHMSAQGAQQGACLATQAPVHTWSGLAVFSTVLTTELGETVATLRGCQGGEGGRPNPWVPEVVGRQQK